MFEPHRGSVVYRAGLANNVRLPCLRAYGGGNAIGVALSLKIWDMIRYYQSNQLTNTSSLNFE